MPNSQKTGYPRGHEVRCLVIDDDEDHRFLLAHMLTKDPELRYVVREAATGEEGLADLEAHPADLLLLDYKLPGSDGLSLLRVVRQRYPELAIVFVTGLEDPELAHVALETGADHFLFKNELETSAVIHGVRVGLERRRSAAIEEELSRADDVARTISSYLPADLAGFVLATDSGARTLDTARRFPAAMLFADIANSSLVGEQLGPEETIAFLNAVFSRFEEVLHEHEGILDKIVGDAIVAIFPVRSPGAAEEREVVRRAVTCGHALVEVYGREWRATSLSAELSSGLRVGVSFGDVIRGNVGSARRRDFTVVGRPVNLAKRLETRAPNNALLVDESVIGRLEPGERVLPLGRVSVKGFRDPVRIFRVDPPV